MVPFKGGWGPLCGGPATSFSGRCNLSELKMHACRITAVWLMDDSALFQMNVSISSELGLLMWNSMLMNVIH